MKEFENLRQQLKSLQDLPIFEHPRVIAFMSFFESPWRSICHDTKRLISFADRVQYPSQLLRLYEELLTIEDNYRKLSFFPMHENIELRYQNLLKTLKQMIVAHVPADVIIEYVNTCEKRSTADEQALLFQNKKQHKKHIMQDITIMKTMQTDLKRFAIERAYKYELKEDNAPLWNYLKNHESQLANAKRSKLDALRQRYQVDELADQHSNLLKQTQELGVGAVLVGGGMFTVAVLIYWQEFQNECQKIIAKIKQHFYNTVNETTAPTGYKPWMRDYVAYSNGIDKHKTIDGVYTALATDYHERDLTPSV